MIYANLIAISLLGGCLAAPATHIEHERRSDNQQWAKRSRAPAEVTVPVRVALKQRNLDVGHSMLMERADPDSASYGQHLSHREIAELFEPHRDSVDSVRKWLLAEGITQDRHTYSRGRGAIDFEATIAEVEKLLSTEYHIFEHTETGESYLSTDRYHLPHNVHAHVDFVTPTVGNQAIRKRDVSSHRPHMRPFSADIAPNTTELENCGNSITTSCIRAMYNIPEGSLNATDNQMGIFAKVDTWNPDDLDSFFSNFPDAGVPVGTRPEVRSVDGGVAPSSVNNTGPGECLLDMQLAMPLVYPQAVVDWQVDDPEQANTGYVDTFLDALDASFCTFMGGDNQTIDAVYPDSEGFNQTEMCGEYQTTKVISVSYSEFENSNPTLYNARICYEYLKLGLNGVSLFFSSGDVGPACNNGTFTPRMSGVCPYITSVGGTQLPGGESANGTEVALFQPDEQLQSGGGFSNQFARPVWQDEAVLAYLEENAAAVPNGTFNLAGRAYPDVSAVGFNITMYQGGELQSSGGTSASTPIWASMITLVNEQRLAANKSTVGFINPVLYKNTHIFNDIVEGGNLGVDSGDSNDTCNGLGFNATVGWDPITGLGTPKFDEMLAVFMALP